MRGVLPAFCVLLALGVAAPAAAQEPESPLNRVVDVTIRLFTTVNDCTVPSTVFHIVRRFNIVAGIEYPRSPCSGGATAGGSYGPFINLKGLTVAEALSRVLAIDPRYRMVISDGVVVVRPVQAMSDPRNSLNFGSGSFALEDATLGIGLDAVLSALTGEPLSPDDRYAIPTDDGALRFSLRTGATSAAGALEAIVRAHGRSFWTVRHDDIGRLIAIYTFDGSGTGAGRRALQ